MSIDNWGYLLVGNNFDDIDFSNFPLFDQIDDDDIPEFYYYEGDKLLELKLGWNLMEPSGYHSSDLFGYCLSSPSYSASCYDLADFLHDVAVIRQAWKEWTGKEAEIFVLNVQG